MLHQALKRSASAVLFAAACVSLTGCPNGDKDNQNPTIELEKQEAQRTFTIGETVIFNVFGKDADNDALTFEYKANADNDLSTLNTAMWFTESKRATFRWTPDSADVTGDKPIELIFIVKDDRGGYVDRKVLVNIVPGNGVPRFEGSANELYKDCCDKPLGLEIRVRDDDSESVELAMTQAPQGADFAPIGKDGSITRGRFTWKPTAEQAKQRVHNVVFTANDNQNQVVMQRLTIIIPPDEDFGIDVRQDNALDDICAGDDIIEYTTLVPERVNLPTDSPGNPNLNTILIEAKLSDLGKQTYDEIFLSWKLKDPLTNQEETGSPCDLNPSSQECQAQKDMQDEAFKIQTTTDPVTGVTTWAVDYELYFQNDERPFFYRVCAFDKDLNADDPNQIICSPRGKPMFYSFRTYRSASDACIEEPSDMFGSGNDAFENATPASVDSWTRGFACQDNKDYYRIKLKPGAKLKPSVVYSPDQDITVKLFDKDFNDVSGKLNKPACGGIVNAELQLPMSASGEEDYYLEITGSEAVYHTQVIALEKAVEDACIDDDVEPNETTPQATPLVPGAPAKQYEMCVANDVDVYKFDLNAGDQLDVMMRYESAAANIADMAIFKPSQRESVSKTSLGDGATFVFNNVEENLSYAVRECGTHHLLVAAADSSSTGKYSLEATVTKASCQDTDQFAGDCNHTLGDAQLFALDTVYSLELCGESEDWLKRSGSGGLDVIGEVVVTSGNASDVTFEAYDASGTKVADGELDERDGTIYLSYTIPNDDVYYFRVASDSEDPVTYDLQVVQ